MQRYFAELGEKPFRGSQVLQWIHQHGVVEFSNMSNIAKALREQLANRAEVQAPEIVFDQCSRDGTRKWLLRLQDGNCIEMVFIPEDQRGTLCVSSQVGCALNCTFCFTARQGYNRNLTAAEIISQIWIAEQALRAEDEALERPITNVVMMGMGEPLLNYANVVSAMRIMLDDLAYGLSKRRVTLSTSGVVPALKQLKQDCPVSLAVSLHAPNDAIRSKLVPINKTYPLAVLLPACREFVEGEPRRRVTMEYIMLDGINDQKAHARELVSRLRDVPSKVNLIPFNPFPYASYRCSSISTVNRFRDILMNAGIMTVTRKTRGDDIDAACGQLAGRVLDRTKRSARFKQLCGREHIQ